jgi:guanine deaminase
MKNDHKKFMREAVRLAKESVGAGGGPFGAVVVKDGHIIARGMNRVTIGNDPTAHGEIVAIREACRQLGSFQLEGCVLYTSSEPCPMCLGAIYWARPAEVYFACSREDAAEIGFDDSFIYEEIDKPMKARKIPCQQIMREAGQDAFRDWREKKDRVEY